MGQPKPPANYIQVRFQKIHDRSGKKYYYKINAEGHGVSADKIYTLRPYNHKKRAVNAGGMYFPASKTISANTYNYFDSPTDGINFLSENGWELVNVSGEVGLRDEFENNGQGTLVPKKRYYTIPVYYLKK
jgi:hypothetical protein